MKWCLISLDQNIKRFEFLSQFMASHGIPNELTNIAATLESFPHVIKEAQGKHDQIRIGSFFGDQISKIGIRNTEMTARLKSGDAFTKKNDVWWPQSFLFQAMIKQFGHNTKFIDLHASVFVVGAGSTARVAIGAFAHMGFLKFHITDRENKKGMDLIADIKRTYFNVDFQFVPQSSIMVLPGTNSVMINTTPLNEQNQILMDLYYFNFLKNPATVIDMNLYPIPSPLSKEATELGAHCIHGYQIAAQVDIDWIHEVTGKTLDLKEYSEGLKAELSKIEFDTKPFERIKD